MGEGTMKVGSLFSGIGGLELGLEWAGMQVAWQVEYDSYCQRVLAERWPNVKRYGDIYEVNGTELEWVDVICGGFPCQPFSHAGKRKGPEDSRWLWPEFYRIVCEVRPRWVIIENVPGLLSIDSGRVFGSILRDLSEAGYDAEWRIVSAADVGARHLRKRVFIVGYTKHSGLTATQIGESFEARNGSCPTGAVKTGEPLGPGRKPSELADAESAECQSSINSRRGGAGLADGSIFNDAILAYLRRRNTGTGGIWQYDPADVPNPDNNGQLAALRSSGESGASEETPSPESSGNIGEGGIPRTETECRPASPGMGIVADGIPGAVDYGYQARVGHKIEERVNRLKCLGNAVVPQVSEYVGLCIMNTMKGIK